MGEGGEDGDKTQNLRKVGKGRIKEGEGEKWGEKKIKREKAGRSQSDSACSPAGSAGLLLSSLGGFAP